MYQMMFPYWGNVARERSGSAAENRFAERLCAIESVVVSTTLDGKDATTRIVRSNPTEDLLKLKQQPGKKIFVDSISILPELTKAGLIDEFHLVVHPVIAGHGKAIVSCGKPR